MNNGPSISNQTWHLVLSLLLAQINSGFFIFVTSKTVKYPCPQYETLTFICNSRMWTRPAMDNHWTSIVLAGHHWHKVLHFVFNLKSTLTGCSGHSIWGKVHSGFHHGSIWSSFSSVCEVRVLLTSLHHCQYFVWTV